MSRKVRELALRQQAQAKVLPRRSWGPEIAGVGLIVLAVLSSAGVIG
jgi:hypothetical protein